MAAKKCKSAVAVVTSNSSTTINEWIAHQFIVGFDKIIVVLDKCTDDTFQQIHKLPPFILERVDIHNNQLTHDVSYGFNFQRNAAMKVYDLYKDRVEWLALFDDDEFFYDHQRRRVNDLLATIPVSAGQVFVPWLCFGHSDRVLLPPPPMTKYEWFQRVVPKKSLSGFDFPHGIKSFVRLSDIDIKGREDGSWYRTHCVCTKGDSVTFDGRLHHEITEGATSCVTAHAHYDTCLAHYAIGSMQEFVQRCERWQRVPPPKSAESLSKKYQLGRFVREAGQISDSRMLIYADELRAILSTPESHTCWLPTFTIVSELSSDRLEYLKEDWPFPSEKPDVIPQNCDGWFFGCESLLSEVLSDKTQIYVELGSFTGASLQYAAKQAPNATLIAIDKWDWTYTGEGPSNSPACLQDPYAVVPLWETFVVNQWDLRDRIIPIRLDTLRGLMSVYCAGIKPDVIYVDADHEYKEVKQDIELATRLFPDAVLCGHDYKTHPSVKQAVDELAIRFDKKVKTQFGDQRCNVWLFE